MKYQISQISNRDLQLLCHYRIIKQPSDYIKAVYRDTKPVTLDFGSGIATSEVDSYNRTIYRYECRMEIPKSKVPMLEFSGLESDWSCIEDFTEFEVLSDKVNLYSSSPCLSDTLKIEVYWCKSYKSIEEALSTVKSDLDSLKRSILKLDEVIHNIKSPADPFEQVSAVDNHLIKLARQDNQIKLGDAGYSISTGAIPPQTIKNPTSELLKKMGKVLGGNITLQVTDGIARYLTEFTDGSITIQGNCTLYLYNIKSRILLHNFTGAVYADQCSYISIGVGCSIAKMELVGCEVEQSSGRVVELTLTRHSIYNHQSGSVVLIRHIGVGCVYHSEVKPPWNSIFEPRYVPYNCIEGMFCQSTGKVIIHGQEVTFVTGQHDDSLPPSEIKAIVG